MLFDRHVDTYTTLKEKIATALTSGAQAQLPIGTVGIVQHGNAAAPYYKLLDAQVTPAIVTKAEANDPSLSTWTEPIEFFNHLKTTYGTTTIDLISCAFYANRGWVYVLQQLETQLGINFRASINNTGNIASGGDWIQESDGVNIQDIYFTDAIQDFVGLLMSINNRRANQIVSIPGTIVNSRPLPYNIVSNGPVSASTLTEGSISKIPVP